MIIYYIVPHTFLFDFDCDQIHHTDLWKRLTGSIWSPKTIDWRQKKCLHVFDSFPGECLWFQKFEWLPSWWIRSHWSLKKINCDQINRIDLWKRSAVIKLISSIFEKDPPWVKQSRQSMIKSIFWSQKMIDSENQWLNSHPCEIDQSLESRL